jgi:ribonuclease P protein component
VYAEGRRIGGPGFVLFYRPGRTARHRLGLTVPRRVGGATVRNRMKRRLRDVFRACRAAFGERPLDIVVNVTAADLPEKRPLLEASLIAAAVAARAGRGRPPRPAGSRARAEGKGDSASAGTRRTRGGARKVPRGPKT